MSAWSQALRILSIGAALIASVAAVQAQTPQTPISDSTAYGYYGFLFRHVAFLKTRADEKVAKGQTQTQLRQTYKIAANLTDSEAAILENVSLACTAILNNIDGQAASIVAAAHANPHVPKAGSPSETALASLHQQKMQAVLGRRDALRRQFGEQRFTQFEIFLKTWMTTNHNSIQPIHPRATQEADIANKGAAK